MTCPSENTDVSRRRTLAALGGAALTGLAGCSSVTEQSFEATPVALPEAAREALVLAETASESETIEREPAGDVEVTITNHAAVYRRGPARGAPTALEQYASGSNQTPGSGSVINALASEAGVDDVALPFFEEAPSVAGDRFSVLVLEAARGSDAVDPRSMMALVPGPVTGADTVTYTGEEPGAFFPGDIFFPEETFFPDEIFFPDEVLFPDEIFSPDSPSEFRVFVPTVDSVFIQTPVVGIEDLPEGAERVEPGETMETAETVVAGRLADFDGDTYDFDGDTYIAPPSELFDAGVLLPLAGQPFGLGVLATPDASVAGESANPLVDMETTELLQRDEVKRALAQAGLTDVDAVEWRAGPRKPQEWPEPDDWDEAELVGEDTTPEFVVGVTTGEDGPWGVLLVVARITDDDHVVAVGAVARPVGTVDGGMTAVEGSGWGMDPDADPRTLSRTLETVSDFAVTGIGRLDRV